MTREERELAITYLEEMKEKYIEGEGYEIHPLPEYYTIECAIKALQQNNTLDKIRADIKAKIEEEEFARSVFRHEERDAVKAEQCTGSIMAYNNVIKFIDKYKSESEK